jgi:hypothetical protein
VRRDNLRRGADLFERASFLETVIEGGTEAYRATDLARPFVRLLSSKHARDLRQQSAVVWQSLGRISDSSLEEAIDGLVREEVASLRAQEASE